MKSGIYVTYSHYKFANWHNYIMLHYQASFKILITENLEESRQETTNLISSGIQFSCPSSDFMSPSFGLFFILDMHSKIFLQFLHLLFQFNSSHIGLTQLFRGIWISIILSNKIYTGYLIWKVHKYTITKPSFTQEGIMNCTISIEYIYSHAEKQVHSPNKQCSVNFLWLSSP